MAEFKIIEMWPVGEARAGVLHTKHGELRTPVLLPVMSFIAGTTVRSGGIWKYTRDYLLKANIPMLSQIMHFLDFSVSPKSLNQWRQKTIHEWYNYTQPLFLDSGGFKLLTNQSFDLDGWGFEATPESILDLQQDFGGDIIATLDYPLPLELRDDEALERMNLSIRNAVQTLKLLQERGDDQTVVFIPIHGRTPAEIKWYINHFLAAYHQAQIERNFDGFAIGSLVPRRNGPSLIMKLVSAAKSAISEAGYANLPVHVFGVASDLIPFLIYLGVDSLDSNTYIQSARNLIYTDPKSWKGLQARKLEKLDCGCDICRSLDLDEMKKVLNSEISYRRIDGKLKSEYYAMIAIHNLNLHLAEIKEATDAARSGCLEEHLIEFAERKPKTKAALEVLAAESRKLKEHLTRKIIPRPSTWEIDEGQERVKSLRYKPSDFSLPSDYKVPENVDILLLIPCSNEKPYSASRSFKLVYEALKNSLGSQIKKIYPVIVSGLYGPVPLEFEDQPQIRNYDYQLTMRYVSGINRVAQRLSEYMAKYATCFNHVIAYAPSKPYRKAILEALEGFDNIHIFPEKPPKKASRSTIQKQGLQECIAFLLSLGTG